MAQFTGNTSPQPRIHGQRTGFVWIRDFDHGVVSTLGAQLHPDPKIREYVVPIKNLPEGHDLVPILGKKNLEITLKSFGNQNEEFKCSNLDETFEFNENTTIVAVVNSSGALGACQINPKIPSSDGIDVRLHAPDKLATLQDTCFSTTDFFDTGRCAQPGFFISNDYAHPPKNIYLAHCGKIGICFSVMGGSICPSACPGYLPEQLDPACYAYFGESGHGGQAWVYRNKGTLGVVDIYAAGYNTKVTDCIILDQTY